MTLIMPYLIGGENTYESLIALNRIISTYKKNGFEVNEGDVSEINSFDQALAQSGNLGLFASKKVTLIKGLESATKDQLNTLLDLLQDIDDFVIWSRKKLDKRTRLYKYFSKHGKVEESKFLEKGELRAWLRTLLEKKGVEKLDKFSDELIVRVGNNQSILESEVQKLEALLEEGVEIDKNTFDKIAIRTLDVDIWDLIDELAQKNKNNSLKLLEELLGKISYEMIVAMIARQLRLFLYALSVSSAGELANLGIHPYVARKTLSQVQSMNLSRIKKLYNKLVEMEILVKTGRFDRMMALDLFVIAF